MNFVSCVTWVAKGVAKSVPDLIRPPPEELNKHLLNENGELEKGVTDEAFYADENSDDDNEGETLDEEASDVDGNSNNDNVDDTLDEETSNVDGNSDDDNEDQTLDKEVSDVDGNSDDNNEEQISDEEAKDLEKDTDTYYNIDDDYDDEGKDFLSSYATFMDNQEDNYITDFDAVKEDEEEDKEDFIIKENDNLLLVGHIEEKCCVLEVHVYNKEEDSFYIHHDIFLEAYPLALEWLDFSTADQEKGNYVAVADMTPVIKIWDLDVADILEPYHYLGKKSKRKNSEKIKKKYHTDAVLSLNWNKHLRTMLASGSADSSIILWDLVEEKPLNKLNYHTNKVQSLQWHPYESSFLLSGSADGTVKLFDCRTPDAECKSWTFEGEIEKVAWNLTNPLKFLCSNDQGFVHSVDIQSNKVEHSFKAHADAVTGIEMCPQNPNILVTSSMDKTIKIWDLVKLKHIETKKLKVGSIYAARFAPDEELTLAVGGNDRSNPLKILDLKSILNNDKDVKKRTNSTQPVTKKRKT